MRKLLIGVFILSLIISIAYFKNHPSSPSPAPTNALAVYDSVTNAKFNLSQFSKIQTGMTYKEVVKILGQEGVEMSRTEIAGNSAAMYSWQNPSGSNLTVMIQNNKVSTKAQFGLQ